MAWKFPAKLATTRILGIEWSVGRSGVVRLTTCLLVLQPLKYQTCQSADIFGTAISSEIAALLFAATLVITCNAQQSYIPQLNIAMYNDVTLVVCTPYQCAAAH